MLVKLAPDISAFANADGGTLVIGISDKRRSLEGINSCGDEKINDFINAPKDCCRPMPRYQEEFVDIINADGKPDRLLLLQKLERKLILHVTRTLNILCFVLLIRQKKTGKCLMMLSIPYLLI